VARGWDSKAVEDQIDATEAAREAKARPALTEAEIVRRAEREGLLLARARLVAALEASRDARYRELTERSLAHVDAALAALDDDA
jgi:hypothetical protein